MQHYVFAVCQSTHLGVCSIMPAVMNQIGTLDLQHKVFFLSPLVCNLTILRPIDFPIKFDTVKSGWFIVYIEGLQVIISKNMFLSLKIDFILAIMQTLMKCLIMQHFI